MLKAKIKPCKLGEWRNKSFQNLDEVYEEYGLKQWFDVYACDFSATKTLYAVKGFEGESYFLSTDLIIKEFE